MYVTWFFMGGTQVMGKEMAHEEEGGATPSVRSILVLVLLVLMSITSV